MKPINLFSAIIIIQILLSSPLYAQSNIQDKKATIAVLDFIASSNVLSTNEMITVSNKFRSDLVNTDKFIVLERGKMEDILKEQNLSLTDICNTSECAVEVGRLLVAEKIVTGNIGKIGSNYSVTVNYIDVSTGKVEKSISEQYRGSYEGLLNITKIIALKLTGLYVEKKSHTWKYIAGSIILCGGAGAAYLLRGKPKPETIGKPPGNPETP